MPQHSIIVVGASTGGVAALQILAAGLPSAFPAAMLVVIHRMPHVRSFLPQILSLAGPLPVIEATHHMPILPGRIVVAASDHHMLIAAGFVEVVQSAKEHNTRPAVDPLFRSAADIYGERVIGVVLTGALYDGTAGLLAVKRHKGIAVVQDPAEALVPGMPRNALDHVKVDYCLPVARIASLLIQLVQPG